MKSASQASGALRIDVMQQGPVAVVRLTGPVDVPDAGKLSRRLDELVEQRPPAIVLDLGQCDFICSLGLGAIVSAHIRCRHHRGIIKLVKPPSAVVELLAVTRLDRLFQTYPRLEDALGPVGAAGICSDPPETH